MRFNRVHVSVLTLALAALTFISGCSGEPKPIIVDKTETTMHREKGIRFYQGKPFSGEIVTHHSSGQIASSEKYELGKRNGLLKKWFPTGELGFESNYSDGKLHGVTRSWWANGNPRSEQSYRNGLINGTSMHWYRDGKPFKKMNYVDGNPEGIQQAWRPNGKLFSNYEYRNGRVFGLKKSNLCFGLENENITLTN